MACRLLTFLHVSNFKHMVVSVIYGYNNKRDHKKRNLSSHTCDCSELYCSWTNTATNFNITVPICFLMHFGAQAHCFVWPRYVGIPNNTVLMQRNGGVVAKSKYLFCPWNIFRMNCENDHEKYKVKYIRWWCQTLWADIPVSTLAGYVNRLRLEPPKKVQ